MSCSTRPVQVPHEAEALVWARTSSRVVSPFAVIVPVILPLQMPLQPQISASSGSAATAAPGSSAPPPWKAGPKISVSRISEMFADFFLRSLNQAPSATSPNSTVPMILSSFRISRL